MKLDNKDLIQSYILTAAKYEYSVYEKRILYRIIELMQFYTNGKKLNEKYSIQKTIFDDVDIVIPIEAFMKDEKDHNYERAKEALESLNKKVIKFEDDNIWRSLNLIERPAIIKKENTATLRISPWIARAFLDFSKGFSKYELKIAMEFGSTYAMRFYELLSNQKKPITYSIDSLKKMFNVENKYTQNRGFIKKVVETAKKELDKKSPYSFFYETIKRGRSISSIKFYPVLQPEKRDVKLEKLSQNNNLSLGWDLSNVTINYLKDNYSFTEKEIKNNRTLFVEAEKSEKFDLLYFLSQEKRNSESKKNPKGWIIQAIRIQLGEKPSTKKKVKSQSNPENPVQDMFRGINLKTYENL